MAACRRSFSLSERSKSSKVRSSTSAAGAAACGVGAVSLSFASAPCLCSETVCLCSDAGFAGCACFLLSCFLGSVAVAETSSFRTAELLEFKRIFLRVCGGSLVCGLPAKVYLVAVMHECSLGVGARHLDSFGISLPVKSRTRCCVARSHIQDRSSQSNLRFLSFVRGWHAAEVDTPLRSLANPNPYRVVPATKSGQIRH